MSPSTREHLNGYNTVDIALDTFPYHGTATTCEALWMGVPVMVLAGRHHVSRVGVSLPHQPRPHRPESQSPPGQYLEKTLDLAADFHRLTRLRAELRGRMAQSPPDRRPRLHPRTRGGPTGESGAGGAG